MINRSEKMDFYNERKRKLFTLKTIDDKIDKNLGPEIAKNLHCHFSKIEWTGSGEKKHLTFDDNEYGPDFKPLIDAIVSHGLTPTIICESAGTQSDDALAMKKYYLEKMK